MLDGSIAVSQSSGTGIGIHPWTGSLVDGSIAADTCNGWTDNTTNYSGGTGSASSITSTWLEDTTVTCDTTTRTTRCVTSCPGNLVAYYKFDTGSGSTAFDSSGNGYDGTLTGGTWLTAECVDGSCLSFNGTDEYVTVGGDPLDGIGSDVTYSMWLYKNATGAYQMPFCYVSNSNDNYFLLIRVREADETIEYAVRITTSSDDCIYASTATFPLQDWTHLAITTTASEVKLYLDGIEQTITKDPLSECTTVYGVPEIQTMANTAGIGALVRPSKGNYFNGYIDELKVYGKALTATEIEYIYNEFTPP
jgi:hypothetical protein